MADGVREVHVIGQQFPLLVPDRLETPFGPSCPNCGTNTTTLGQGKYVCYPCGTYFGCNDPLE